MRHLDPDAAKLAADLTVLLPRPLHQLGVAGARDLVTNLRPPAGPEVHSAMDTVIPVRDGAAIEARIYRVNDNSRTPVMVYIHGGGFTLGSLDGVDALCRTLALEGECAVVSLAYRLSPEHKFPVPVQDCFDALVWLVQNAAALGLDPDRIAVAGDSAGANLAIAASSLAAHEGIHPRLMVLAYPPTEYAVERPSWIENANGPLLTSEDVLWFWSQYLRDGSDRLNPLAFPSLSPDLSVLPPTLVIAAAHDVLRDDGLEFVRLLKSAGVETDYECFEGVFHGFFTEVGSLKAADEASLIAGAKLRKALHSN
jgi:acetyl esterase